MSELTNQLEVANSAVDDLEQKLEASRQKVTLRDQQIWNLRRSIDNLGEEKLIDSGGRPSLRYYEVGGAWSLTLYKDSWSFD